MSCFKADLRLDTDRLFSHKIERVGPTVSRPTTGQQVGVGGTHTHLWVHPHPHHPCMFLAVRVEQVRVPKGAGGIMFLEAPYTHTHIHPHPHPPTGPVHIYNTTYSPWPENFLICEYRCAVPRTHFPGRDGHETWPRPQGCLKGQFWAPG